MGEEEMLPECHEQSVYCTLHNEQWVQCIQYLIVQCVQYLIVYFAQLCNISLVIVHCAILLVVLIVHCAFCSSCIVQKLCNVQRSQEDSQQTLICNLAKFPLIAAISSSCCVDR